MLQNKRKVVEASRSAKAGYVVDLNVLGRGLAFMFLEDPNKLNALYAAARSELGKLQKEYKEYTRKLIEECKVEIELTSM